MLNCTAPCWAILLSRKSWGIQMYKRLLVVSFRVLLCLLHAVIWLLLQSMWILFSVGAYGCTVTHSACWRIPVHPQQLLVYGDAPRAPRGHYTHHFCHIMFAPNSAPPYFIIISCPVSLYQTGACHAASYHTTFYLVYLCFYCYTLLMNSLLVHFTSGCKS